MVDLRKRKLNFLTGRTKNIEIFILNAYFNRTNKKNVLTQTQHYIYYKNAELGFKQSQKYKEKEENRQGGD